MSSALLRLQPDDRLVALLREGHARAFDEISRRYRAALVRFACAFVPDSRAEDVVQEAMLRAHDALLDGDAEVALRPWLYRIVRNGAISERRTIRPYEEIDDQYDGVPQPPDIVERRERFREVLAGVVDLPDAQREALVSTELEGETHEEIAQRLDTTPGGVRQLVFRARTTLRNGLGLLLPMPLLRVALGFAEGSGAQISAGGAAGGAAAAATGGPLKIGATVAATVAVIGSGASLDLPDSRQGPGGAERSASIAGAAGGGGGAGLTPVAMTASAPAAKSSAAPADQPASPDGSGSGDASQSSGDEPAGTGGGGGGGGNDVAPAPDPPPAAQPPPPKPPPPPPQQPAPSGSPPPPGGHVSMDGTDCPPESDDSGYASATAPTGTSPTGPGGHH
jgi:RNA polymerase sigma factor (sigma-70 family)